MSKELLEKSILICGCGNILFGDDGFGPAVVQHLKENYALPDEVLVLDVGTSIRDLLFNLLLSDKKPEKIIVVDAVDYPDRRPGDVFEIPVEGIPDKKVADFSLHQFPTVNLLSELNEHTRVEVTILVAQIEALPEEVRPGLTAAMARAVPKACDRLMSLIREAAWLS